MKSLYTDRNGKVQTANNWINDMGGIECVIGRPVWGIPDDALVVSIMAENGLTLVK